MALAQDARGPGASGVALKDTAPEERHNLFPEVTSRADARAGCENWSPAGGPGADGGPR